MMTQQERKLLPPHGLHFLISSKDSFIYIIPDRIIHTMAFVTQVVEHLLVYESLFCLLIPLEHMDL